MKSFPAILLSLAAAYGGAAAAQVRVEMNAIDIKGVGASIGTITLQQGSGGVTFTPDLKGLKPGQHGIHVHEFGNCAAKEKDGKMSAGEMAGGHYDPKKLHNHAGPNGKGHAGDLPALRVDAKGEATGALGTSQVMLKDLHGKSIVIHEGGDNYSDQPKPNGGGGERIACGVVPAK